MKINTSLIKTPSNIGYGMMHLDDGERNTVGKILIDFIATKQKLELSWNYMTCAEVKSLLDLIGSPNRIVAIEYFNPAQNAITTKNFYTSDKSMSPDLFDGTGNPKGFKTFTVNAVEE